MNNRYRYRLLIKCKNNQPTRMIRQLMLGISAMKPFAAVTVFADMNPKYVIII